VHTVAVVGTVVMGDHLTPQIAAIEMEAADVRVDCLQRSGTLDNIGA